MQVFFAFFVIPCKSVSQKIHAAPRTHHAIAICRRFSDLATGEKAIEMGPIEKRTGIRLAARRDVGMANDVFDRIVLPQNADEPHQGRILRRIKRQLVTALEFDADREIVAAFDPIPTRGTGMPRAQAARHELHDPPIATNQEMSGDAQELDFTVIGMRPGVQRIGKKAHDTVAAKQPRGQRYGMNHDQPYRLAGGPLIAIGGEDAPRAGQPALGIKLAIHSTRAVPCDSAGNGR